MEVTIELPGFPPLRIERVIQDPKTFIKQFQSIKDQLRQADYVIQENLPLKGHGWETMLRYWVEEPNGNRWPMTFAAEIPHNEIKRLVNLVAKARSHDWFTESRFQMITPEPLPRPLDVVVQDTPESLLQTSLVLIDLEDTSFRRQRVTRALATYFPDMDIPSIVERIEARGSVLEVTRRLLDAPLGSQPVPEGD